MSSPLYHTKKKSFFFIVVKLAWSITVDTSGCFQLPLTELDIEYLSSLQTPDEIIIIFQKAHKAVQTIQLKYLLIISETL